MQQLQPKIVRLHEHLERIAEHPHVGNVRQRGFIVGIDLVQDKNSNRLFPWEQKKGFAVCSHALKEGVWLRPLGSTLVLMPPLAISLAEIDLLCAVLERAIRIEFS